MLTAIATALTFARKVPREAWYIAAALALLWWHGSNRYQDGRESVLTELRTAEAKAADKALEAITEAGEAGVERAEVFEAQERALGDAIKEAEANDTNSLDAIF